MRYVYIDESEFAKPDARMGIGMLISDAPVEQALINQAIQDLGNDPDIQDSATHSQDQRTLDRNYFHACDDSKNSHSHLMNQINSSVHAEFMADFQKDPDETPEQLLQRSFANVSIRALQSREPVHFYIEGRGNLSEKVFEDLLSGLKIRLSLLAYDQPFIPAYYPKCTVQIVNKQCPGIQACDFLLWTVNRKVNEDTVWYSRINKGLISTSFESESNSWGGESVAINRGVQDEKVNYEISDMPSSPDDLLSNELLAGIFVFACNTCVRYAKEPDSRLTHFQDEISFVAEHILNPKVSLVEDVARVFLKIFDTADIVPVSIDSEEKGKLLIAKKYMGLVLRKELVNGMFTLMHLNSLREHFIAKDPMLLCEGRRDENES